MNGPTHQSTTLNGKEELDRASERYLFHHATEYMDRGWSVIPLFGKKPALNSWAEFQSRRPSLDELRSWFGEEQDQNIGIVTGQLSGLAIIDCDSPEAAEYWHSTTFKSPLTVRTGSGGVHIYYRMPAGASVGNRVRVGGRALDVRGEGGYVVAPPSRHASGNLYEWLAPCSDYCLEDIPFFDPSWVAIEPLRPTSPHRTVQNGPAYIRKIVAISGQRGHDQTYKAACILREAGLTPEEALTELLEWNETNAEPRWSLRELLHKVQSAYGPE